MFTGLSPHAPKSGTLLGLYEDETPLHRSTKAQFMMGNNSAVTVQVGGTAALRCLVNGVTEQETVSRRDDNVGDASAWGD